MSLPFHPRQGYPPCKVALADEKDDEDGKGDEDGAGHEEVPAGSVLRLKNLKADLKGLHRVFAHDEQRPKKLVPSGGEGENAKGRKSWLRERQYNPPVDAGFGAAIDAGRVFQFRRKCHEELPQEKNAEGAHGNREDETGIAVEEAMAAQAESIVAPGEGPVFQHDEDGDHRHLARDHHRAEHEDEEQVSPAKTEPRKRIGSHRAEEQVCDGNGTGVDEGVDEVAGESSGLHGLNVIAPLPSIGEPDWRKTEDLGFRLERCREHPEERQYHAHRAGGEHQMEQ